MFPHFTFSGTAYQALHRKLTLFCTCVTQIILLALSALCVFVAEKNINRETKPLFSQRQVLSFPICRSRMSSHTSG